MVAAQVAAPGLKLPPGIRVARESDAAACLGIYAPAVRDSPISFELEVPSVEAFARRMRDNLAKYPWLVMEKDGQVAGYAYASDYRVRKAYQWCVEVSVYVAREFHRQGVGRELYSALFAILRRQGLFNAYAIITLPNPASVKLHESRGFRPIGVFREVGYKLGRWHDVGWWGLRLREGAPAEVTPFSELA